MTAEEAAMFDPQAFALYRTSPGRAACPLGERLSDAQHRIGALQLIASRHAGEAVAVVTHAVMIRLAFVHLTGIDDETWRRPVGRGSVTGLHASDGSFWQAELPGAGGSAGSPAAQVGEPTGRGTVLA